MKDSDNEDWIIGNSIQRSWITAEYWEPGGDYPLASVNLVLGVVTCSEKLSLVIEYVEDNIDSGTMERIKEKAMESLLSE